MLPETPPPDPASDFGIERTARMNAREAFPGTGTRMVSDERQAALSADDALAAQHDSKFDDSLMSDALAEDLAKELPRQFSPQRKDTTMAYDDRLISPSQLGGATYPGPEADMAAKSAYLQQQARNSNAYGEQQAPREAPIARLANAIERLGNAAALACATSDLLCGREPTPAPGNASKVSEPDGLFAAMSMLADRIEHHTDTIQSAMNRIHKIGG